MGNEASLEGEGLPEGLAAVAAGGAGGVGSPAHAALPVGMEADLSRLSQEERRQIAAVLSRAQGLPKGGGPPAAAAESPTMHRKEELDSSRPPRQPGKPPDPGYPIQPGLSKSRTTDTFRSEQKLPGRSPSTISLKESKSRTDVKEESKSSMMPGFLSEVNPLSAVSSVVNKFNPFDLKSDSDTSQEETAKRQKIVQKEQGKPEGTAKPPLQQSSKPVPRQQGPVTDPGQQEASPKTTSQQAEKMKSQPPSTGKPVQGATQISQPHQAKSPLQRDATRSQTKQSDTVKGEPVKPVSQTSSKPPGQQASSGKPPVQQPGLAKSPAHQPGTVKPPAQPPGMAKPVSQQAGAEKPSPLQTGPKSAAQPPGPGKLPAQQPGPGKSPAHQVGTSKPPALQPSPQSPAKPSGAVRPPAQQPSPAKLPPQQAGQAKRPSQQPGPAKPSAQQPAKHISQVGPGKPPQPPTMPSASETPAQGLPKSICPLCNTTELLLDVPEKANFNTCTECQTSVCNLCGFNPNPHLTEVKEWLCLNCQMQRALGGDLAPLPSSPQMKPKSAPAPPPADVRKSAPQSEQSSSKKDAALREDGPKVPEPKKPPALVKQPTLHGSPPATTKQHILAESSSKLVAAKEPSYPSEQPKPPAAAEKPKQPKTAQPPIGSEVSLFAATEPAVPSSEIQSETPEKTAPPHKMDSAKPSQSFPPTGGKVTTPLDSQAIPRPASDSKIISHQGPTSESKGQSQVVPVPKKEEAKKAPTKMSPKPDAKQMPKGSPTPAGPRPPTGQTVPPSQQAPKPEEQPKLFSLTLGSITDAPKSQPTTPQETVTGKLFGFGASIFSQASSLISTAGQPAAHSQGGTGAPAKQAASPSQPLTSQGPHKATGQAPAAAKAVPVKKESRAPVAEKSAPKMTQSPAVKRTEAEKRPSVAKDSKQSTAELPKAVLPPEPEKSPKPDVACPLCKADLNVDSHDPPNFNTCTECKSRVCNRCGFNPTPHLTEGLKESAEEMVRNKLEGKDKLTPWEQFLEKKKEKKRLKKKQKALAEEGSEDELPSDVDLNDPYFAEEVKKLGVKKKSVKSAKDGTSPEEETEMEKQKAEMALLVMDEEEDGKKHFNYDKIVEHQNLSKKKRKQLLKRKELVEDDFEVNVTDVRFQAMYTSHLFNLDPSDPNFKKTKAMEKILEEKARQRELKEQELTLAIKQKENEREKESQKKSMDPALSMLIKSVKSKTEQFQARKKQKVK